MAFNRDQSRQWRKTHPWKGRIHSRQSYARRRWKIKEKRADKSRRFILLGLRHDGKPRSPNGVGRKPINGKRLTNAEHAQRYLFKRSN